MGPGAARNFFLLLFNQIAISDPLLSESMNFILWKMTLPASTNFVSFERSMPQSSAPKRMAALSLPV